MKIRIISLLAILLTVTGCADHTDHSEGRTLYVSIAPLKYFVEQIADTTVRVEVLVPETTSPETYEPTMQQIRGLSRARAYISIGLIDFEQVLLGKIGSIAPELVQVRLAEGIELLEGTCGHDHGHDGHHHAVDPHIWLSPTIMRQNVSRIEQTLSALFPEHAGRYDLNARELERRIEELHNHMERELSSTRRKAFAIGHPSLTYFARNYGLTQIPIESDGKEPSVRMMRELTDRLNAAGIKSVFYQRQTTDAAARTIAREIGGRAIEFDPLAADWAANLRSLCDTLRVTLNE